MLDLDAFQKAFLRLKTAEDKAAFAQVAIPELISMLRSKRGAEGKLRVGVIDGRIRVTIPDETVAINFNEEQAESFMEAFKSAQMRIKQTAEIMEKFDDLIKNVFK